MFNFNCDEFFLISWMFVFITLKMKKKNPLKNIWKNSKEVCSLQMMLSFFDHYHYYHHDLVFVEIYCYPFALKSTDRHNDDFSL